MESTPNNAGILEGWQREILQRDLVMLRLPTPFGYSNTWWRVLFIDSDGTFIGELERLHWCEYEAHKKGDHERFDCNKVQGIYQHGEVFCYSDEVTICSCSGLCRNK